MASTPTDERPLSPHLFAWRWHLTMLASILHRLTGVALAAGALLLAVWIGAAAAGPDAYAAVEGALLSPLGRLMLFGFTLAVTYHLASGVRHLVWDAGFGFDPKLATAMTWVVLLVSVVATLGVWSAAYWL